MKLILVGISIAGVLVILWLFVGVYEHREFRTYHLFLKNRPTLRLFFWSRVGESDQAIEKLPAHDQRAEKAYREFVEEGNGYKRSIWLRK